MLFHQTKEDSKVTKESSLLNRTPLTGQQMAKKPPQTFFFVRKKKE